jgi:hypothetical protein
MGAAHGFLKLMSDKSFELLRPRHRLMALGRHHGSVPGRSSGKSEIFARFALLAVQFGNVETVTAILRKPSARPCSVPSSRPFDLHWRKSGQHSLKKWILTTQNSIGKSACLGRAGSGKPHDCMGERIDPIDNPL